MSWLIILFGLFFLPLIELWVMTQSGLPLSFWVFESLATAWMGWYFSRRYGGGENFTLWSEMESDWRNGRVPTLEAMDSMMVLLAGWLLIVPGPLCDLVGGAMMTPAVRRQLLPRMRAWVGVMQANRRV
ncbi:MAG: FxsA family protein [Deltaproteobacteria bacterium]|nr:FxsA family protein [Deltaproteobacteria bacterium]